MSSFDLKGKRVWVAGHRGMAGSAIVRRLESERLRNRHRNPRRARSAAPDGRARVVGGRKIDAVFLAAATVGGILANSTRPADFLYDNLVIETNVIHAAKQAGVKKLLFLGSSCIYPRMAEQPMREEALLTGAARAHQRVVRHRQDCRDQAVPGLPASIRLRFRFRDADKSLRAGRPLRRRRRPRRGRADHEDSCGQTDRQRDGRTVGQRARRGGSFSSPGTWPTPASL